MKKKWKKLRRKLKKWSKALKRQLRKLTFKNLFRCAMTAIKTLIISFIYSAFVVLALMVALAIPGLYKTYVVDDVRPNVYRIFMDHNLNSGGTGFNIKAPSGKNYVLTNAHICDSAIDNQLLIEVPGARPVSRRILENSGNSDLCLLEGFHNTDPLHLASGATVGSSLIVLGHPLLNPLVKREGTLIGVRDTWITSDRPLEECIQPKHSIRTIRTWLGEEETCAVTVKKSYLTDIEAYPGSSGSPTLNWNGSVVGVLFAVNTRSNWAIIVPLQDIRTFLKPY